MGLRRETFVAERMVLYIERRGRGVVRCSGAASEVARTCWTRTGRHGRPAGRRWSSLGDGGARWATAVGVLFLQQGGVTIEGREDDERATVQMIAGWPVSSA